MRERLAGHTTFGLGGECADWARATTAAEVRERILAWNAAGQAWRAMGGGSNLLVADEGVAEAVLCVVAEAPECAAAGDCVEASAATALDDLARWAAEEGRGGLGFASGIPGTVGGGICGNAGAFGAALGDVLERVEVVTRAGSVETWERGALRFGYRFCSLRSTGAVAMRAWFRSARADRAALAAEREGILAMRREKHPDWRAHPTAGSFFKNLPPAQEGGRRIAAGQVLEEVGAKDMRVGGAYVYEKHANIVVAGPGATAQDVGELASRMAAAVRGRTGILLEPEVQFWGDFGAWNLLGQSHRVC
jgi:UDP-N-acetylmuramate dehydrogenase